MNYVKSPSVLVVFTESVDKAAELNSSKSVEAYFMDRKTYDTVESIIKPLLPFIGKMLAESGKIYWEDEWHDKLSHFICSITKLKEVDINTALNAILGY